MRRGLKRMKSGKAVGPDDIPVQAWKCLGEVACNTVLDKDIQQGFREREDA